MVPIQSSDRGIQPVLDKTLKRKLSNRESARKSRMKKQEKLQDLSNEINQLQKEIGHRKLCVDASQKKFMDMEAQNKVLMAQKVELERRLESLDNILASKKHQEAGGYSVPIAGNSLMAIAGIPSMNIAGFPSMNILDDSNLLDVMDIPEISDLGFGCLVDSPEIPDHMVNPWQLQSMDYPGMFQC